MRTAASAPGKLVLLGEYAVLFGHPSLVMAVDRRARVELGTSDGALWSVSAPGFCDDEVGFSLHPNGGFEWAAPGSDEAGRLVLVKQVVKSLIAAEMVDPENLGPASIRLDTNEFFLPVAGGRAKLGLGSSAALTVALAEAIRNWVPEERRRSPLDLTELLELHRSFQSGRGSGIDLAASTHGGVVEYRLIGVSGTPDAATAALPPGLSIVYVWTGRSASTSDFLARLEEGMRSDGGAIDAAIGELGRVSTAGIAHLRAGDIAGFLGDVDEFADSMEALGHAAGISVLSEEHLRLQDLANISGVRYKPSGAGGGDVGLGFTDDPEAAAVFAGHATDAGFTLLDLHIDSKGVRVDRGRVE